MNIPMTEEQAQGAMESLNIVYRAAQSAMPSGLVAEAQKVQADGINEAATVVAKFIQATVEPAVSSNIQPVEVVEEEEKPSKK